MDKQYTDKKLKRLYRFYLEFWPASSKKSNDLGFKMNKNSIENFYGGKK